MSKIRITTDSTADIPKYLCEELDITVLPLSIHYEEKEYLDGETITPQEFYELLEGCTTLPTTSQLASFRYLELFEETLKQGYTDLIHVSINAKGSGTYQAGMISRDIFFEEHPEAVGKLNIHIIDSTTYSMTYGIPVCEGAKMAKEGASAEEIIAHITDWVAHGRPMFVPLTLKFVKKSGRVSAAAAFVGEAMGLKPLITFENGESKVLTKIRGEAKAITTLVETCLKERKPGTNYALVYGNNDRVYQQLKAKCAEAMDMPPFAEYPVGCIIGLNTGPDMIAIIYRT